MVLVTVLSLQPCCAPELMSAKGEPRVQADACCGDSDCGSSEQEGEDCGSCSPFFTCGNCSGFTCMTALFRMPLPPVAEPMHFRSVSTGFYDEVVIKKWQPPKIG